MNPSDKELIEQGRAEAGSLWKLARITHINLSTLSVALARGGNLREALRERIASFLAWPEEEKANLRVDKRRKKGH